MLHLIFQSFVETTTLNRMATGDVAVFLENSLFRLLKTGALNATLTEKLKHNRLYVLSEDLAVRGISSDALISGLEIIDYTKLVALTVENPVIQTWA